MTTSPATTRSSPLRGRAPKTRDERRLPGSPRPEQGRPPQPRRAWRTLCQAGRRVGLSAGAHVVHVTAGRLGPAPGTGTFAGTARHILPTTPSSGS
ncbi:hypothetical protein C7C45_23310 [Micromonospora arborensis]|uniref:Uncharacterized protein n=1 Tax=Micromonospora arborensis TaxID=2116518 RepID=A0A318NDT3_9ACTN|nr:hypothetical protein C7C45_23310 [Micromonospora arborensis]